MASPEQVKQYLAHWFQLGKPLVMQGNSEKCLPKPVMQNNRYSDEFEACWQRATHGHDCYLDGTEQTIAQLLSAHWDITACARCQMPVPMLRVGMRSPNCPCIDLPSWPNMDLPKPRPPVDSRNQLSQIRDRLITTQRQSPSDAAGEPPSASDSN